MGFRIRTYLFPFYTEWEDLTAVSLGYTMPDGKVRVFKVIQGLI